MEKAKIFMSGNSQAVRLPKEYRLNGEEVYIKRMSNAIILLPVDDPWKPLFDSLGMFPDDFMEERNQPPMQIREDIFE